MMPRTIFPAAVLLGALALGVLSSSAPASLAAKSPSPRYDITYLWTPQLQAARDYKKKVSQILGPGMAARLKIAKSGDRYGVIYRREGDLSTTQAAALKHSRVLLSRGLRSATTILSQDWTLIQADASSRKKEVVIGPRRSLPGRRPDLSLERRIEEHIKDLRRTGRIADDEKTAWSVYDFSEQKKLVDINEDLPMQGASLVKPFFALAYFHQVNAGKLQYAKKSRRQLEAMFQRSSNPASNWVLRQVGGPGIAERLLRRHYGGLLRQVRIVEYIPWSGRTYRNLASAHDYSRFLYAMWKDELPYSKELKRLMALPNRDRIFTGASSIPAGTQVYNKTGSTRRMCGDMGILEVRGPKGKLRAYTIIGLIDKNQPAQNYDRWIRTRGDIIREVSNMVYEDIMERHNR